MKRNRRQPDREGRVFSAFLAVMILAELALFAGIMATWIGGPK